MARVTKGTKSGKPAVTAEAVEAVIESLATLIPSQDAAIEAALEPKSPQPETAPGIAAPSDTPAPVRKLQGFVDSATRTRIEGWAWNPETPNDFVVLELLEGDTVLLKTVAGENRPGLEMAGVRGSHHAFKIELPYGLLSDDRHLLTLRCADTGLPVPGSPIAMEAATDTRKAPVRFFLDEITDKAVTGWITMPNEPMHHCVVVLKERGNILARSVASGFRPDLLTAGIGDGCYAFNMPMPLALLDGQEHLLEIVEEDTGFSLTDEPVIWRSTAGTAGSAMTGKGGDPFEAGTGRMSSASFSDFEAATPLSAMNKATASGKLTSRAAAFTGTRMMFDISDLIYYIAEHSNLTGIQRVQSSIVLAMIDSKVVPPASLIFLSFNARTRNWVVIPTGFLISLLRDLFLPDEQRMITFPSEEARYGLLPGARSFDGTGVLDDGNPSVLCMLGAAWVHQDYFHRVLAFKRRFGTRFVMTIHDLIPIYARETCDQDTARVFEEFMQRALRHVDHILSVSENTARDIRRYLTALKYPEPPITVTQNGSSFAEFLSKTTSKSSETEIRDLPERFVLFVATIEGRKNHQLIYDIWKRMVDEGMDPPQLICVGRLGWKATQFVSGLVETNYLDGHVRLLREISDTDLEMLYSRCLFTVCPTFYEGWGLPVGESLALGKICVSSDRASIPEVAGDCGVYIDIDSIDQSMEVIRDLITDDKKRKKLEEKIRRDYKPITWKSVATRVIKACDESLAIEWEKPYPYTNLPYATEVSFGRMDQDTDGTGELLLARIMDARRGHFLKDALDQKSFTLGEEIRSGGSWAQPERWGAWLCHAGGDVVFSLAENSSQYYYVFVQIRVCGVLHEHPIRLVANTDILWEGRIGPHSKDIALRIRKKTTAPGPWRLRVGAQVDLSTDQKNQILALDGRGPTIGFERMIVVPGNDLETRLDVLTNFLLD